MTENPFRWKGAATADAFCGREDTLDEMVRAMKAGTSVALAASRRSGKSWMAQTILERLRDDRFLTAYLDLVHVHSPLQWIERFAGAVLNSIAATPEELFQTTRKFLPSLDLASVSADARGYRLRLPPGCDDAQLHSIADQVYSLPRLIAKGTGYVLEATGSYVSVFFVAGSAYLVALAVVHACAPRLDPAELG